MFTYNEHSGRIFRLTFRQYVQQEVKCLPAYARLPADDYTQHKSRVISLTLRESLLGRKQLLPHAFVVFTVGDFAVECLSPFEENCI